MSYQQRDRVLSSLGYSSYGEYLRGELWRTIRRRVFRRDKVCQVCHNPAKVVHHKSYARDVLLGKDDSALVALCDTCHTIIEFEQGKKRSFKEVQSELRAAMFKRNGPKPRSKRIPCHKCGQTAKAGTNYCRNHELSPGSGKWSRRLGRFVEAKINLPRCDNCGEYTFKGWKLCRTCNSDLTNGHVHDHDAEPRERPSERYPVTNTPVKTLGPNM